VAIRFSPDGRVFVAEKSGLLKVFDSLSDTTPTTVADLRTNVHDFWDRGMLGLALHPDFPTTPYVYVLYTYDFDPLEPSRPAPRWGDTCPDKDASNNIIGPGATTDGCVVNGRVSRLTVNPDDTLSGGEQVILENNWCQQFPSHSIGSLVFGTEGALYVSAGDGASFNTEDWGQFGGTRGTAPQVYPFTPANPCADPNRPRGTATTKPTAEGGALRAQDVRTLADASVSFDGSILRINPDTGAAWPDNPLVGGTTAADDRTIAYGLRNPFRMTRRPGTNELWIGDVGWNTWEEINRITSPSDATVENFGWPCVEGPDRPSGYNSSLNLCTSLATASTVPAYYNMLHGQPLYTGDPCPTGNGAAVSGLAFYTGGTYPASWNGALFFADHSRNCVFVMTAGVDGLPDVSTRTAFLTNASGSGQLGDPLPVDLEIGPGGDLFVVDFEGGRIRRVQYNVGNNPPNAVIQATPSNGPVPLLVQFDGTSSSDPDPGATLFYAWDLDGDGQYDDSTLPRPVWTYSAIGPVTVRLRVTDDDGATATTTKIITAGNSAPTATITAPSPQLTWRVGDSINFSGQGFDTTDGVMPPASMSWMIVLHHCPNGPTGCHEHTIETRTGVDHDTFTAPDHEYYSYLEFRLTVTDSGGLTGTDSVSIDPQVVTMTYETSPPGLIVSVADLGGTTPFTRPAIIGSTLSFTAVSPQTLGPTSYYFASWNDGGGASRALTVGTSPQTFHANFAPCQAVESACDGLDNDCDGTVDDVPPPAGLPSLSVDATQIAWTTVPGAFSYDLVRGSIGTLRAAGYTAAVAQCVASGVNATAVAYEATPAPGQADWFLVRANSCAAHGTYNSGGAGQIAPRDAAINAAGLSCP
jgi:glucose/arabinose dehydrogenase/PKD repeat protein